MPRKPVGGFFPLELPLQKVSRSLLDLWGDESDMRMFHAARAAIRHVLASLKPKRLWAPAYMSTSIRDAVNGLSCSLEFFPVGEALSPEVTFLQARLQPGDAVLAVDYFGRNPDKDFLALVRACPEILWIEDRAQAMLPASEPWGDYVVYSLRKIGFPDGGIVVRHRKEALPQPQWQEGYNTDFLLPPLLRYEDEKEQHNEGWYSAYRERERHITAACFPMSRLSRELARATDPEPILSRRRKNYAALHGALKEYALFPEGMGDAVPFGFPVRLEGRDRVAKALAQARIFAPSYWPELPSPEQAFPKEHLLSKTTLLLPCDHRYGEEEMRYIIDQFRRVIT